LTLALYVLVAKAVGEGEVYPTTLPPRLHPEVDVLNLSNAIKAIQPEGIVDIQF
jgi:hypothetical protein